MLTWFDTGTCRIFRCVWWRPGNATHFLTPLLTYFPTPCLPLFGLLCFLDYLVSYLHDNDWYGRAEGPISVNYICSQAKLKIPDAWRQLFNVVMIGEISTITRTLSDMMKTRHKMSHVKLTLAHWEKRFYRIQTERREVCHRRCCWQTWEATRCWKRRSLLWLRVLPR